MEPNASEPVVPVAEPVQSTGAASPLIQATAIQHGTPDAHLRAFIANSDHPCPNCGYNLRGLRASACPECNQELKLTIGLVEPKLGAWLAGVLGLAVGAGFSLMMMGYLMFTAMLWATNPFQQADVIFVIVLPAVFMGACLLALLRNRGRFRKLALPIRIGVAVTCWLLTLANLTVFSIVIR